jgi:peptidoglycan/xylan/chitin deacetylase (PgdA/CDA1 family)
MRTQVAITIDTEFSIGGAFADPERRTPLGIENVTCPVDGEEQGLGFLLETFARYGTRATFFVEALQTYWFGDAPMGSVVERILSADQDVQLHLHPCWTAFRDPDWKTRLSAGNPNDNCDDLAVDELGALVLHGIAVLQRLGAPRPVALRTGNLRAGRNVYRAMAACALPVASNVGVGLNRPADPALRLRGGRRRIEGVLEVPVLSYIQPALGRRQAHRLFATTATSTLETEALLWAAREAGVQTLVLLTHPFEFIKGDRLNPAHQRANRINQRRLERLCAFLADHDDEFESVSFGSAAPAWLAAAEEPEPRLYAPLLPALGRMVENKANDLIPAL